jgi:fructose-bisphosphate aldolase class I
MRTINQKSSNGKTIPAMISETGAVPGIKVDTGAKDLAQFIR